MWGGKTGDTAQAAKAYAGKKSDPCWLSTKRPNAVVDRGGWVELPVTVRPSGEIVIEVDAGLNVRAPVGTSVGWLATDLRLGFDGLYGVVESKLKHDPLSGHVCVFCNRARTRVKLLSWDGSGLWLCTKRLEHGRFAWPQANDQELEPFFPRGTRRPTICNVLQTRLTVNPSA